MLTCASFVGSVFPYLHFFIVISLSSFLYRYFFIPYLHFFIVISLSSFLYRYFFISISRRRADGRLLRWAVERGGNALVRAGAAVALSGAGVGAAGRRIRVLV